MLVRITILFWVLAVFVFSIGATFYWVGTGKDLWQHPSMNWLRNWTEKLFP